MRINKTGLMIGASAVGLVQIAAASAQESDTIVVTARKTEETLLETPVAVSVLTGEFLDRSSINTVGEVVRFVPGFDLTPQNTTRATGSKIRGISTFSFSDGFESSVATVIDGVVLGREAQGFFDLFDIESLEIIKGPQGTLFGKNASAGVVNIRTRNPEFTFGGGGDITYGSFNEVKTRGTITGPIIDDKLAFRLSGTYHRHDGLLDNRLEGQDDLNDKNTYSLRGKLLYVPTDNLDLLLTVDHTSEDNRCCLPTFRTAGAPTGAVTFAANSPVLQLGDALDALGIVPSESNRDIGVLESNILQESEATGIALQADYEVGNGTFTSITSWREWEIDEFNEADGISTSSVNNRNGTVSSSEQFTQEFRYAGSLTDQLDLVAGLFYFHQDLDATGQVDIEIALPFPPFFNVSTVADRTVETDSFAVFGEATYSVTDKLSIVLGGRYTDEEISANYDRQSAAIDGALPFGPFFGPDLVGVQEVSEENFSGRGIIRYFWTENLMTYFTYSRGYKGPGIDVAESANADAIAMVGGLPVLDAEIPTLYELGLKTRLFDDTLEVNAVVYTQDVDDLQTITTDSLGTITNLSIDRVNSTGIEIDTTYTPPIIEGLTLTGTYTLNEVDIEKFEERTDLEDQRLRDSPRHFYSLVGDYRRPNVFKDMEGFARAEWTWQSEKNSSLTPADFSQIDSYGLLNLRAGLNSADGGYGVSFAVENVTDEDYAHFILGTSYGTLDDNQTSAQYIGEPRTYSVTLRGSF